MNFSSSYTLISIKWFCSGEKYATNERKTWLNQCARACLVAALVGEVQLGLLRVEVHSRLLAHHLGVDGLVGLNTNHQLVPLTLVFKNVSWDIRELQPHLSFPLVQSFSTAQDEGNAWGGTFSTREDRLQRIN